jgi:two-component system response regulator
MSDYEILIVEDDPDDLEVVTGALRSNGFSEGLRVARDGEEALRLLREPPPPRMILLDLNLPKLDGLEVLRSIRNDPRTKRIPVVVLTTSWADADVERAYDLCVSSYIVKPTDYGHYDRLIREVSHYWLTTNHPAKPAGA